MNYLYEYFFTSSLGIIELIASICTLICVWQCAKQNIWNFFFGAIAVILFGYIFMNVQLYADMVLQWGYFLPISLFGWWYWMTKGNPEIVNTLPVSSATNGQISYGIIGLVIVTPITGYVFNNYLGASYAYADSYILVASVFAQYLLSKKYLENWVLWISVDVVAVPVYALKGLYIASGLYAILFCLATYGLITWFKEWKEYPLVPQFGRR